jgi:hypothetical protein
METKYLDIVRRSVSESNHSFHFTILKASPSGKECSKLVGECPKTRYQAHYQTCIQEISQTDPFDWVAFQELRKYSKSWEESTLRGFGIPSRCVDGPETEEANIFHVNRAKDNFRKCSFEKIIAPDGRVLTSKEDVTVE